MSCGFSENEEYIEKYKYVKRNIDTGKFEGICIGYEYAKEYDNFSKLICHLYKLLKEERDEL